MYKEKTIICPSVDLLVKEGVNYINNNGRRVCTHAGDAIQTNNTTYVLTECRNRLHTLRSEKAIKYFARELLSYFSGSLDIHSEYGLAKASKFWEKICDENNCINSNYGYYVFHQKTQEEKTQLDWVREQFIKNMDTRKALININNIYHKNNTKDFPCTIGMLFSLEGNVLNCDVQSRSTDVITGLPYDMGFFSVIDELLASLLTEDLNTEIIPGYVAMHANYTQIYDRTKDIAKQILMSEEDVLNQQMPKICSGTDVLNDIYNLGKGKPRTRFMEWSVKNGK